MESKVPFRIIGDVHGQVTRYITNRTPYAGAKALTRTYASLIADAEESVQIGDMGWREDLEYVRNTVDSVRHKVIYGNHDDYDNPLQHSLGDYGVYTPKSVPLTFFYIRGEHSIDKKYREWYGPKKTWWHQEELDYQQMNECLALYEQVKPDVLITHGCPSLLYNHGILTNAMKLEPSRTAKFLDYVITAHRPKRHYFGHHHHDWKLELDGTRFECINELCFVDCDKDGNFGEQQ